MAAGIVLMGAGLAACSSGAQVAPPLREGDDDDDQGADAEAVASGDATVTTASDAGGAVVAVDDASDGADADPCPTQRAQLESQLANTACGVCVSASCATFVTDVETSCTTIAAASDLLTCAQVSHMCQTAGYNAAFNTVELASLYQCGSYCYSPCGLKAPAGVDAGDDGGIADAATD